MFVSPPTSYVEILKSTVMEFKGEAGQCLGYESGVLRNEVYALKKSLTKLASLFYHVGTWQAGVSHAPGRQPSPQSHLIGALISGFPAFRTVSNQLHWSVSCPACGIWS